METHFVKNDYLALEFLAQALRISAVIPLVTFDVDQRQRAQGQITIQSIPEGTETD